MLAPRRALPFLDSVEIPMGLGQLLPGLPSLPGLPRQLQLPRELAGEGGRGGAETAGELARRHGKTAEAGRVRSQPPEAPRPGAGDGRQVILQVRCRLWPRASAKCLQAYRVCCWNIRLYIINIARPLPKKKKKKLAGYLPTTDDTAPIA